MFKPTDMPPAFFAPLRDPVCAGGRDNARDWRLAPAKRGGCYQTQRRSRPDPLGLRSTLCGDATFMRGGAVRCVLAHRFGGRRLEFPCPRFAGPTRVECAVLVRLAPPTYRRFGSTRMTKPSSPLEGNAAERVAALTPDNPHLSSGRKPRLLIVGAGA